VVNPYRDLSRNDREVDHGEEGEEGKVEDEEDQASEESRAGAQEEARGCEEERGAQAGCQEGEEGQQAGSQGGSEKGCRAEARSGSRSGACEQSAPEPALVVLDRRRFGRRFRSRQLVRDTPTGQQARTRAAGLRSLLRHFRSRRLDASGLRARASSHARA